RVVGDGVVHVGNAAFVHQVHDQLELVQTLEVSHFRCVARFNQGFKACFNQLNRATTQNGLLTEQVGFSLVFESGFNDTGAAAANCGCVRQGDVFSLASRI